MEAIPKKQRGSGDMKKRTVLNMLLCVGVVGSLCAGMGTTALAEETGMTETTAEIIAYDLIPLWSNVTISADATADYEGNLITETDRSLPYLVEEVIDIPQQSNSVRAYKLYGTEKWILEQDLHEHSSAYSYMPNGDVVMIKLDATSFLDGTEIGAVYKERNYLIEEIQAIYEDSMSVRAYQLQGVEGWVIEQDLELQLSGHSYIAPGKFVTLHGNAATFLDNSPIPESARGQNYLVEAAVAIEHRSSSYRAYKLQGLSGWVVEQDVDAID
jgi:hypothetical protein